MNRFPAYIILSVTFLGKFVVTGASPQSGPEEAVSGLMASWNLKDAHAFASQFTEDATFVNVNGALWIGRKDIEDRHAKAGIFKSQKQPCRDQARKRAARQAGHCFDACELDDHGGPS
jgi:ketosteroid isomerase-like protein